VLMADRRSGAGTGKIWVEALEGFRPLRSQPAGKADA
jgi:hypothetical protein